MICGWDVKWLAYIKERHGANYQSQWFGTNKEMKVFGVDF
jgi:hypothetical protein